MRIGSKPTIRDVAKRAGVSVATVSYVLNDNRNEAIGEQTKRKVWEAVRALNYHRAAAAVGLARQKTRNIGIVLYSDDSALTNHFYSFVIEGVIRETMDRDYNLLFSYVPSRYRGRQDLPKIVREANVAGVIFVSRIYPKMLRDIQQSGIPLIAIDNHPRMKNIASVQIDNWGGGELAARHLLSLGHERIAVIGDVPDRPSIAARCEGFAETIRQHGIEFSMETNVLTADALSFEQGHRCTLAYLRKVPATTALFCANDEVAAGALQAVHELGRRVPDDVSIVGFDDIVMSNYTAPPLTTVSVGKEQLGRSATAWLLDKVEDRVAPDQERVAPVQLIVRASTQAVSKRTAPAVSKAIAPAVGKAIAPAVGKVTAAAVGKATRRPRRGSKVRGARVEG